MKGPGLRIGLDVRRTWQCPKCTAKYLLHGWVVAWQCHCVKNGVWMELLETAAEKQRFVIPSLPIKDIPADIFLGPATTTTEQTVSEQTATPQKEPPKKESPENPVPKNDPPTTPDNDFGAGIN